MPRLRYWLLAALLATACGTAGDEAAANTAESTVPEPTAANEQSSTTTTPTVESSAPPVTESASIWALAQGFWLLESYTVDGEAHQVDIGVNASKQPWIEVGDNVGGNAGCNLFGAQSIEWVPGGFIAYDVGGEMRGCGLESEVDLMATENALRGSLGHPGGVEVVVLDNTMTWRVDGNEFTFYRTEGRPAPPTTLPPQAMGRLDCSPGYVTEQVIEDSVRETEQILRDEIPEVVRTEQDLEFAPPAPDGWFWLGYDAEENLIAFIARGDIEPPRYQLWRCSDG